MVEEFRKIKDYQNYEISNLGRVKSLSRNVWNGKTYYNIKEKILVNRLDSHNYYIVTLLNKNGKKTFKVHKLVAISFLNHKPNGYESVIDHIDNNRLNNKLDNLQITTQRKNSSKDKKNKSSKYTGVSLIKSTNKWYSYIRINGIGINLGCFDNEYDAHLAYQEAINKFY